MGQGADQVRRGEPIRLREGESVVIRPDEPGIARGHTVDAGNQSGAPSISTAAGQDNASPDDPDTQQADDPAAIEAEIERTRADMSGTIDAIQQRLSPEHLKAEAKETVGDLTEQAKEAAREAVQHAVHEVKSHAREALLDARDAVRGATIGRVEDMARTLGDTTEDARYGLVETIRQNPVPAALAGIGLAWLFMNRQSAPPQRSYRDDRDYRTSRLYAGRDDRYYGRFRDEDRYAPSYPASGTRYGQGRDDAGVLDRTKEKVGQVADQAGTMVGRAGEAIGQATGQAGDAVGRAAGQTGDLVGRAGEALGSAAGQVGETASTLATQAQETAGNLAQQAQQRARRVEGQLGRTMQENPLALGAVALALGTAVGLALPQTARENQLLGEARDTLVERAQGLAQEVVEKVQSVAGEAGQTIKDEAQKQGLAR